MLKLLLACVVTAWGAVAALATPQKSQIIDAILDDHILPGFATLSQRADRLNAHAQNSCLDDRAGFETLYHHAFDAWIKVSHLRFGPTETNNRAFALAFWPDPRSKTPKALTRLIGVADPVIETDKGFASISIAGRGFYALEYLVFDPRIAAMGDATYRCAYIRALTRDIAATAQAIRLDWQGFYGTDMRRRTAQSTYRTEDEALQELFKAFTTGLQINSDMRLGRPLGTFERPRPKRAEARRSGRSFRHVVLSMTRLQNLALLLAAGNPELTTTLELAYGKVTKRAGRIGEDAVFANVATIQGRLKVESLQIAIDAIRLIAAEELGPYLGVGAGFNALDGD